ncbi:MAG TPA: sigma-70 family RNA polymerase sigma factor [Thermoanaerobaculia bacterium]|jgi:RNA polymerase sigma-70 factor (ECF subfamily)|nr:sigma-70 family RNA polymerase sigma factor [Thermoanaerobaculia bacterium]
MPSLATPETAAAPVSDAVLIRRIGERQAEALQELYRRHAPNLLALGKRILGAVEDAEEVLQEVFLRVWQEPLRYNPERSSVSTWLVLIMRSRAIDRLRNRRVVERAHGAAYQEAGDSYTSPEGVENVLDRQREGRVRSELLGLPAEQRQALEMAFFEGLTQSEISEKTGIPLGTVKTRTLLAMKKLRKNLRQEIRELL